MSVDGEYIVKRLMPEIVEQICHEQNITIKRFSDDWIMRLEQGNVRQWIIGYTFGVNSASASALARDKVASYQALADDNVPAIEHYLARSRAIPTVLMDNLTQITDTQPVVIKPLQGTSGHGIHLFGTKDQAVHYIAEQPPHTDWTMSPWHDIAKEIRVIICDGTILCAYEKLSPTVHNGLRLHNLGMGARAVDIEPDPAIKTLVRQATKSTGLRLGAIDVCALPDRSLRIVEVNEGIMMEHYARQSDEYKNRAAEVYRAIIMSMFS